jgi:Uma2 family endonuclease
MSSLEHLIDPLQHSPRLPEALRILQANWAQEQQRREQFYRDITPEQKAEFIEGKVIVHSPSRNRHLEVTLWILKLLDTFASLRQLGEVKSEKCLCVFPRNDYEPDIVFFGPEKAATLSPDTLKFPVPDLIVEVLSESTESRDRGVKFEDYAASGVGEYWIVDADRSLLEQYVLRDGEYELALKASSGRLQSGVMVGMEVDIEAFFDAGKNLRQLRTMLAENG